MVSQRYDIGPLNKHGIYQIYSKYNWYQNTATQTWPRINTPGIACLVHLNIRTISINIPSLVQGLQPLGITHFLVAFSRLFCPSADTCGLSRKEMNPVHLVKLMPATGCYLVPSWIPWNTMHRDTDFARPHPQPMVIPKFSQPNSFFRCRGQLWQLWTSHLGCIPSSIPSPLGMLDMRHTHLVRSQLPQLPQAVLQQQLPPAGRELRASIALCRYTMNIVAILTRGKFRSAHLTTKSQVKPSPLHILRSSFYVEVSKKCGIPKSP